MTREKQVDTRGFLFISLWRTHASYSWSLLIGPADKKCHFFYHYIFCSCKWTPSSNTFAIKKYNIEIMGKSYLISPIIFYFLYSLELWRENKGHRHCGRPKNSFDPRAVLGKSGPTSATNIRQNTRQNIRQNIGQRHKNSTYRKRARDVTPHPTPSG